MGYASTLRPIQGAVATQGVSDRVEFLRKTYKHLGFALVLWTALTAGIFQYLPGFSRSFSQMALGHGGGGWFVVIILFAVVKSIANKLAMSDSSAVPQYIALVLSPLAEAIILQPVLWILFARFTGSATSPEKILFEASAITMIIFLGLTATVFLTKKDFSFLRGILNIGMFAMIGIALLSWLVGFNLGMLYCAFAVALMAGYILYQTSSVMAYFPPTKHVAAALMLYSTIATLFWYILQILMSTSRRN
jgi:hypothetical protein